MWCEVDNLPLILENSPEVSTRVPRLAGRTAEKSNRNLLLTVTPQSILSTRGA